VSITYIDNESLSPYLDSWSSVSNTQLEKYLYHLDVNTVIVCGCNFPNCPKTAIYEASERDFRIIMIKDYSERI
jgi:nicotinamidase-related amidase